MTDDRQERIRQRAHAIWEQAGRPDGAHQQHWDQATAEIDGEESRPKAKGRATGKATKPKAVRPRKSSAS
ncbi:MAG: DUF2934 domain-containing protein [Mesorhizobium sp.]|uniref:DUF2934 domain-containing protein n=1 Tax=unclassified Mesorhizobium TaxID=325217 RepID=UPI000FCBB1B1|nr:MULTISPECIES: DUF2934 domain-containing protein [unclassified Mesorhizobium]RUV74227.1 DUF2934 domain-containing protein [Mesorhizobium sp. M5C.F.Cr.IN.023.01.1.1]RWF87023.1 MAG: DUF2934 domain-containing protein [Mesorhizobium sp.]RWF90963.1 MAG: DUF2934 domain-containing protein [Mesorhizobium sp.]RWI43489.1 MAG: DUF2934 domain-containing protein [Mesorhizobium sp.]RWI47818.1 MAG: DUF2934 domain-containing protein [Mesorhizobium sp.]